MYDKQIVAEASRRITVARARLASAYPFLGKLILRLKMRFGDVGTACTDMTYITFDIEFMNELDDDQLDFVLLHEVMHCVLKHCTRGLDKIPLIYNIACDIVVNSFILETKGIDSFVVYNEEVMHLAPDDSEGREHTAEEVYDMLIQSYDLQEIDEIYRQGSFDNHESWGKIDTQLSSDQWDKHIRDAVSEVGNKGCGGVPLGIKRYLEEVVHTPTTNWRQLLQDYIRFDQSDYVFTIPDRRYQDDYILPSFQENAFGDAVKGLWLFVDVSGSITDSELSILMKEIYSAYDQVDNISGKISFFDTDVSEPVAFESYDELERVTPTGGGGTSFRIIFDYLKQADEDDLPDLILILTDGYADFPKEESAMEIPVVWLIINSNVEPPWGNTVYIHSN